MNAYFDFFKALQDRSDLSKHIAHCQTIDRLSVDDKRRFATSARILENELGQAFLEHVTNHKHPFSNILLDFSASGRKRIIDFADQLDILKSSKRYTSLRNSLRRIDDEGKRNFLASCSVMKVAQNFFLSGFTIDEIEPKIVNFPKRPDLKVQNNATGETVYVEVTVLGPSTDDDHKSDTYHHISNLRWIAPQEVIMWGAVYQSIKSEELKPILSSIIDSMNRVGNDGFEEIVIDDTLEIALASNNSIDRLMAWADSRNLHHDFIGPLHNYDNVNRLTDATIGKLREKQEQLPQGVPGIIVIDATWNLLLLQHDINYVAAELMTSISRYPQVYAAAIYRQYGGDNLGSIANSGFYRECTLYDDNTEQRLFIPNPARNVTASLDTAQKIRKALLE